MQEVARKIPTKSSIPIIFAFNILRGFHKEFGLKHFLPLQARIRNLGYNVELFPIINLQYQSSIERRAGFIRQHLPEFLNNLGAKQCHILAYSISGLDFRYYISSLGGHEHISSLATLSCPHRGSFLADSYVNKKIWDDEIEPITRLIGIPQRSFKEVCTSNIDSFNAVVPNHEKVKYYSFSALRETKGCSELFKNSSSFITLNKEPNFPTDNDGVFIPEETAWGNHLLTVVADHAELTGLRIGLNVENIYRTVFDRLKY